MQQIQWIQKSRQGELKEYMQQNVFAYKNTSVAHKLLTIKSLK